MPSLGDRSGRGVDRGTGVVRDDGDDRIPTRAFGRSREALDDLIDYDPLLATQAVLPEGAADETEDGQPAEQVDPEGFDAEREGHDEGAADPDRTDDSALDVVLREAHVTHEEGQEPSRQASDEDHDGNHEKHREELESRSGHDIYPQKDSVDDVHSRS